MTTRTLIAGFITYVITRFGYWISGFNPNRFPQTLPGVLLDLGIWLLVCIPVVWVLDKLGIGTSSRDKRTPPSGEAGISG
jgi:hypothetical protein